MPQRKLSLISIDPFDSRLPPVESRALLHLIGKYDQYLVQGRLHEARAMERAVEIVYACLTDATGDTLPMPTDMGNL